MLSSEYVEARMAAPSVGATTASSEFADEVKAGGLGGGRSWGTLWEVITWSMMAGGDAAAELSPCSR
jgi:hypothetical protein